MEEAVVVEIPAGGLHGAGIRFHEVADRQEHGQGVALVDVLDEPLAGEDPVQGLEELSDAGAAAAGEVALRQNFQNLGGVQELCAVLADAVVEEEDLDLIADVHRVGIYLRDLPEIGHHGLTDVLGTGAHGAGDVDGQEQVTGTHRIFLLFVPLCGCGWLWLWMVSGSRSALSSAPAGACRSPAAGASRGGSWRRIGK